MNKEIENLREQNKLLQERLDFMIEQNDKKQQVLDKIKEELFELKDMIYKSETRKENFNVQRKITSMIVSIGKILEEIE